MAGSGPMDSRAFLKQASGSTSGTGPIGTGPDTASLWDWLVDRHNGATRPMLAGGVARPSEVRTDAIGPGL
jgi:hypothetical protein